jgi:hypothetical protein
MDHQGRAIGVHHLVKLCFAQHIIHLAATVAGDDQVRHVAMMLALRIAEPMLGTDRVPVTARAFELRPFALAGHMDVNAVFAFCEARACDCELDAVIRLAGHDHARILAVGGLQHRGGCCRLGLGGHRRAVCILLAGGLLRLAATGRQRQAAGQSGCGEKGAMAFHGQLLSLRIYPAVRCWFPDGPAKVRLTLAGIAVWLAARTKRNPGENAR